ncbi:MAG: UDP-glucose/iron transport system permease protein [bacterium]
MSATVLKVLAGAGFAAIAVGLSLRYRLGHAREIAIAAARALVQLAGVGAAIALVFEFPALAVAFVAVMLLTAGLTAGSRLRGLPGARGRALVAIAVPALVSTGALLAIGAFELTARAAVPTAGILIGGAMAATTLTGRRLLESLRDDTPQIETRLALGDDARTALAPAVRRAVHTGLVPVVDQTRSVGLVTLPGTFVGLILGGATPEEAAATQLVVLLALLAVELVAGLLLAELTQRAVILPGERVRRIDLDR